MYNKFCNENNNLVYNGDSHQKIQIFKHRYNLFNIKYIIGSAIQTRPPEIEIHYRNGGMKVIKGFDQWGIDFTDLVDVLDNPTSNDFNQIWYFGAEFNILHKDPNDIGHSHGEFNWKMQQALIPNTAQEQMFFNEYDVLSRFTPILFNSKEDFTVWLSAHPTTIVST